MELQCNSLKESYKIINDKYDKLKNEYDDLKESLQFTQDELIDKKINNIQRGSDEQFCKVWED